MADAAPDDRLDEVRDELYGVAPDDFVERRTAAVRAAKQEGDRELADAVAALRRPTAAAWAINSFVRSDGSSIDAALDLGARLRAAVERGEGDAIRELMRERARTVAATMTAIRRHADAQGQPLSATVGAQVEQSLRAAMASEDDAELVRRGVLTNALEESGFGAMSAGAVLRPASEPKETIPDEPADEPDDELDDADRRQAEQRISTAEADVAEAEQELEAATERRADLEKERDDLRQRIDDVERRLRDERDAVAEIEARLKAARAELRSTRTARRRRS